MEPSPIAILITLYVSMQVSPTFWLKWMHIPCFVFSNILNATNTHSHLYFGSYETERGWIEGTICEQGQICQSTFWGSRVPGCSFISENKFQSGYHLPVPSIVAHCTECYDLDNFKTYRRNGDVSNYLIYRVFGLEVYKNTCFCFSTQKLYEIYFLNSVQSNSKRFLCTSVHQCGHLL